MTAVNSNPKLLACSRASIFLGVINAAHLGLEVGGPLAQSYLVPYWSGKLVKYVFKGGREMAKKKVTVAEAKAALKAAEKVTKAANAALDKAYAIADKASVAQNKAADFLDELEANSVNPILSEE